ncbi:MAG: hypothetical protein D3906_15015 [Candidatus Electrothrix sp. AUS1_2]|nr:hypothetical protein [Candidatus Electrothrix sp. AUS1_2]
MGVEIKTDAEADELWSYVGNKKNQRRTWYAIERNTGVILARHNGRRTDGSCPVLTEKLSVFPVTRYYTDDRRSCRKYIPSERRIIGKADTWRIERKNLNFRTPVAALTPKPSLNAVKIITIRKTEVLNPSGTVFPVSEKQESQSLHL